MSEDGRIKIVNMFINDVCVENLKKVWYRRVGRLCDAVANAQDGDIVVRSNSSRAFG